MLEMARRAEVAKYVKAYQASTYRMGDVRKHHASVGLQSIPRIVH